MNRCFLFISFLIMLFAFSSCKERQSQNKLEYSKYVSEFTQGMIRSTDPICILFNANLDSLPVSADDVFKISPRVKGTFQFHQNTLKFIPSERFKNEQIYQISVQLDQLFDVPAALKKFNFTVKILPQAYSFQEGNLGIYPENNDQFFYKGAIANADLTTPEQIEQLITAKLDDRILSLVWDHSPYIHNFTIPDLKREKHSQTLKLTFDKKIKNGNDLLVEIPGENNFSVLDIKVTDDYSQSIDVIFSDNVSPTQDLQGLITIDGINRLNYNVQGNIVRLYTNETSKMRGIVQVNVYRGIMNATGDKLTKEVAQSVSFPSAKPEIRFIGEGTITPADGNILIPFSAVGLKAIQLRVVKVLPQNMNFYLQQNSYEYAGDYELRRVGRPILNKKIVLAKEGQTIHSDKWQDYTINLADHIQLEKGVVYKVELRFKRSYTTLACNEKQNPDRDDSDDQFWQGYDNYDEYYYGYPEDYSWEERDNPCSNSYYYVSSRFPQKNIVVTSLGITAKAGTDGKYIVAVNDLSDATPVSHCELFFYNYQNQKIDSTRTDDRGIAIARIRGKAFTVVARKGNDQAYLKVNDAGSLSYSNFDVTGTVVQKGLKGFLYGERGVWRPGNEIHLSFILEDKENVIPAGHPIIAELYDPNGHVVQTRKEGRNDNGMYCFTFKTDDNAVTGYWRTIVKIGGTSFSKTIRIESIKPNRLNINAILPGNILGKGIHENKIPVTTRWLHGAKTSLLKTITELKLTQGKTVFEKYKNYNFDDRSRFYKTTTTTLFDGTTDPDGNFTLSTQNITTENTPGMLNALLTIRVFENSGDFSIVTSSFKYSPYTQYVGIALPETDDNWYPAGKPIPVKGVVVNTLGQPVASNEIEIEVYALDWRWWWDSNDDNLGSYVNRSYRKPILHKMVKSTDGKFNVDITCNEWGRYYLIAKDKVSGHSCGSTFYISSWRNDLNMPGMANLLTLTSDKKAYRVGEKIKIKFPSSSGSIALISIENGKTVKDIFRIPTTNDFTIFEIEAKQDMCPNIYVNVSLIQPHKGRDNDKPIRLYGVMNIDVEDPSLHLHPQINMAKELRPSEDFTITVSEADGHPMTYTLAVVDEGLLSLTSFKTPDPFPAFYAREALGVKTWDFYDDVCGAFGGRLEKAFAIGGDEALKTEENHKSNRFTPVVLFQGPFTLKKGEKKSHTLRMPEYIGEVRTMVIAEHKGQYGSASKNTSVNQPLMLNVTMPRIFTPGDVIEIPVTLFAMKDRIKEVNVSIRTDDKIENLASAQQKVHFDKTGEQIIFFKVKIKETTGKSTLSFSAQSGQEKAYFSCDIDIRIPNPRITRVDAKELKAGETLTFDNPIEGINPTSMLEITSIPPLNLEKRLNDLIQYPHGCGEQITSAVFPQLMLHTLMDLTEAQRVTAELNVKEVISRLRNYQRNNGGFSYWAGSEFISDWVSSYITDFLIQAEKQGYQVPASMKNNAVNYLNQQANTWKPSDYYAELEQAYRLYVLASADKPNLAAMNRMKDIIYKNPVARWQLAGAYAIGKYDKVARSLIANLPTEAESYRQLGRCYGSGLRDNAILLRSMVDMDMQEEAYTLLRKIALRFASNDWMSTQENAFGLCAAAQYVKRYFKEGNGIKVEIGKEKIQTEKTVILKPLTVKQQRSNVTVKNNTDGTLHVRTINSSVPLGVITQNEMSGLKMQITYYSNNKRIDRPTYRQGEDITAEISVQNTGKIGQYDELALTCMFPSGFEFINERLISGINPFKGTENVDIRDDRIYLYFSLKQGETKKFTLRFNASYPGTYLLPAITCSAMYDDSITATLAGNRIIIEK